MSLVDRCSTANTGMSYLATFASVRCGLLTLVALIATTFPCVAFSKKSVSVPSVQDVENVVQRTIRSNYAGLHACYRPALALDRTKGGTLFIQATVGPQERLRSARIMRDELDHRRVAVCVLSQVQRWRLAGGRLGRAGCGR